MRIKRLSRPAGPQRILRYRLLLEQIIAHTPPDSEARPLAVRCPAPGEPAAAPLFLSGLLVSHTASPLFLRTCRTCTRRARRWRSVLCSATRRHAAARTRRRCAASRCSGPLSRRPCFCWTSTGRGCCHDACSAVSMQRAPPLSTFRRRGSCKASRWWGRRACCSARARCCACARAWTPRTTSSSSSTTLSSTQVPLLLPHPPAYCTGVAASPVKPGQIGASKRLVRTSRFTR